MVLIFFGTGFEEIEALATVDILRRAGLEAKMIGVNGLVIEGAHEISVKMDEDIEGLKSIEGVEMLVLPGGVPGVHNLRDNEKLKAFVTEAFNSGTKVAAICAAPSILDYWGLVEGRNITLYPTWRDRIKSATVIDEDVVVDGNLITGRGVGVAMDFGLKLVEVIKGVKVAEELRSNMVLPY